MAVDNNIVSLNLAISKWMNNYFDLIQNCQIKARKSDTDILQWKLMLSMRDGTELVWNEISWTWWTSNWIWFTWVDWNRHFYIWYNKKIYKLVWNTWTDIWWTFTNNNFSFNTVKLPHWNPTATYESSFTATWSNKLKPSASDTTPTNNTWKYLFITGSAVPTAATYSTVDAVRSKYSNIESFDSVNNEYQLPNLLNPIALPNLVRYKIYDTLENYLQITNWVDSDQYYDGVNWNTDFTWRLNQHFDRFNQWFKPQQVFFYNWVQWTYEKWTLFRSTAFNNFWFNINEIIEMSYFDNITEVFVWKNRIVVWWDRSVIYVDYDWTLWIYKQNVISDNYWMVKWWVNNFDKDVYFLTNNKQYISLVENQFWIVIPTNVWATIDNYLQDFNYNISSWFDWRKFYTYWEQTAWVTWKILVYDVQYKFWSVYTWLSPSKFILEKNNFYILSNKSGQISKFTSWVELDINTKIEQKVSTVDIDWNNIFKIKECPHYFLYFENIWQELKIDTARCLNDSNTITSDIISITETLPSETELWENILWEHILWGNSVIAWLPLPKLYKKNLWEDWALIWKVSLTWINWSSFYLNDFVFLYNDIDWDWFNPNNSI